VQIADLTLMNNPTDQPSDAPPQGEPTTQMSTHSLGWGHRPLFVATPDEARDRLLRGGSPWLRSLRGRSSFLEKTMAIPILPTNFEQIDLELANAQWSIKQQITSLTRELIEIGIMAAFCAFLLVAASVFVIISAMPADADSVSTLLTLSCTIAASAFCLALAFSSVETKRQTELELDISEADSFKMGKLARDEYMQASRAPR
jgi:hypothetical protein